MILRMDVSRYGQQSVFREWGYWGVFLDGRCHKFSYNVHISYKEFVQDPEPFNVPNKGTFVYLIYERNRVSE